MIGRLARVIACALLLLSPSASHAQPETVFFRSADGVTEIVGYLFKPATPGPHPAIVMLHGRAGPYSANKICLQCVGVVEKAYDVGRVLGGARPARTAPR